MRSRTCLNRAMLAAVASCTFVLAGCTGRQLYDSAQGMRRQQCDALVDPAEHGRCMAAADADYDSYQRERQKSAPPR